MADYKYPDDDTPLGEIALNANLEIAFPTKRMDEGFHRSFEFKITGATPLDASVQFKIYSGLEPDILGYSNIEESMASVEVASSTGNLVYRRYNPSTLDTAYRIALSGTNPASTATFLIRARAE